MQAYEYAALIADEVRALEIAVQGPSDNWDEQSPQDDNESDAQYRAALAVLEVATWVDPADIFSVYVNETVLEAVYWTSNTGLVRTEWLRTYGGPTCRILFDNSHYAEVVSTGDDSKTARVSVYVPTLADMVEEIAEGVNA